ncbi:MAG TPA: DUF3536 domain-containing protein, partial [Chroococcidiopsis sp.]
SAVYENAGRSLLRDPWQARDEYIQVIRDRSPSTIKQFLARHQAHKLTPTERVDALRLLEMQRHALLMYTSCGWFFEEVSRPEGTQILRYAARAVELAGDVAGVQLEKEFVKRLGSIPSNIDTFAHGGEVYRQLVQPAQISLEQVAAHYAISSLFTTYAREERIYCYTAHQQDYQLQRMGSLTLAVGQLQLMSEITQESVSFTFAVLHLGGWDFHCCIQPFEGRRGYSQSRDQLIASLKQGSAAQTILVMRRIFGDQSYNLQTLFAEERHRILRLLSQETLTRLDQLYTQVYRDNYGILMAFHRDQLDVPQELQVAAQIALGHRAVNSLRALERETSDVPVTNLQQCLGHVGELEAIATEADYLHCPLKLPELQQMMERLILRSLWQLFQSPEPGMAADDLRWLGRLVELGDRLHLNLCLDRAQELYLGYFNSHLLPSLMALLQYQQSQTQQTQQNPASARPTTKGDIEPISRLLKLGQQLAIDLSYWQAVVAVQ